MGFWRDNILLGTATVLSGLANWLYEMLLAHQLGPVGFGNVTSLNNIVLLLSIPASVVTLVATKRGRPEPQWWRTVRNWVAGGVLWLIPVLLGPWLVSWQKIPPKLLPLWALACWPLIDYAANLGYLQRSRRYVQVGLAVVFASFGGVASVIVASHMVHYLVWLGSLQSVTMWGAWGLSRYWASTIVAPPRTVANVAGTGLAASVGILGTTLMLTDMIWAKSQLSPHWAGAYTGLATIGQAIPYLAGANATVLLTTSLDERTSAGRWLGRTLATLGGMVLLAETIFVWQGQWVVQTVLGASFIEVARWLAWYGLAMGALAGLMILMAYAVALDRIQGVWPVVLGQVGWAYGLSQTHRLAQLVHVTVWVLVGTLLLEAVVLMVGSSRTP